LCAVGRVRSSTTWTGRAPALDGRQGRNGDVHSVQLVQGQVQGFRGQRQGGSVGDTGHPERETQGGVCRHQEDCERRHRQSQIVQQRQLRGGRAQSSGFVVGRARQGRRQQGQGRCQQGQGRYRRQDPGLHEIRKAQLMIRLRHLSNHTIHKF